MAARKAKATVSKGGAVIYCRVSTQGQVEDGFSLEIQEERLRAYCTMRGLEVAAVIVDAGVSGGVPMAERKGGAALLELLANGAAHVVALKLDRLFRDAADCLLTVREWDAAGVALHLADMGGAAVDTSSPTGRLFIGMLAGFAEFERAQIAERTKAGKARKAEQGGYIGGKAPFGWTITEEGTLEAHAGEQAIIRAARILQAEGLALRKIGERLEAEGLLPRAGKWHAETVKQVLAGRLA